MAWIRQILESQDAANDPGELVRSIKIDLSEEDVFAVTPKGDVINLPMGATVVDFAFAIHSAVGTRMVGAKVDGKIVQINHKIKTGEVIEIITTNQAGHGPSRDWLNIAVTSSAKAKIRSWFKKEKREENIATGKLELERELRRIQVFFGDGEYEKYIEELSKKLKFSSPDEFYAAIGYGGLQLSKIVTRIKEDQNKKISANKNVPSIKPIRRTKSSEGVVVEGIDNCLVKLSKCCAPLPGEDIIGFITRGHGVSIHKRDCNNVPRIISEAAEPDRWIKAYWDTDKSENFTSTIQAMFINRDGIVIDVMNAINNMRVPIHGISAKETKDGNCTVTVTVSAESVEHLKSIISRIEKIHGAYNVERINQ